MVLIRKEGENERIRNGFCMLDHTLVGVLVTLFSRLVEAWSRATRDVGALEESGRAERSHKVKVVGILGTVQYPSTR